MPLIKRNPRPIERDKKEFRDDRLFIVACDDTFAPKQYFDSYKISRVHVHVIPTEDGTSSAPHVLDRLMQYGHDDDDELWMLLDTDHCIKGSHLAGFTNSLKEAREKGVKVALSSPCFELWLLLHHVDEDQIGTLTNATKTEKFLREKLDVYDKTRLDASRFPLSLVALACERAEKLENAMGNPEIPTTPMSQVHKLWRAIVAKGLPSQLPEELRNLLTVSKNGE
ncbi:RloB family protein [Burkholderia ubonensis]|uniref:RloB family protein n=1 Tax=Burkholderia ubonensis TaxID=101571 RepID=UPI0009B3E0E6|nr:RloB family protein [Burkholderia ubonensis]